MQLIKCWLFSPTFDEVSNRDRWLGILSSKHMEHHRADFVRFGGLKSLLLFPVKGKITREYLERQDLGFRS